MTISDRALFSVGIFFVFIFALYVDINYSNTKPNTLPHFLYIYFYFINSASSVVRFFGVGLFCE